MVVGESAINVSMRSTIPLSRTARRGISKSTIAGVINEKESKLRSLKSTSEVEHEIVENKCSKLQRCQVSCATANSRPEASFVDCRPATSCVCVLDPWDVCFFWSCRREFVAKNVGGVGSE